MCVNEAVKPAFLLLRLH